MRKLEFELDLEHFRKIKDEIVPTIFTEHQFDLIQKRFTNKILTDSEKNEFSRTISKKMKAIRYIENKEELFIYGGEKIRNDRLIVAKKYLKNLSRKFKNKHILISGSFLYNERYNDIDVFVISKYDKEDYNQDNLHINYLTEEVYSSLFFESLRKLCISNKELLFSETKEKANIDTFISLYQELFNDLKENPKLAKQTLREFLIQSSFIGKTPIPDSFELKTQVDSILKLKRPEELIKNIFVKSVVLSKEHNKIKAMKGMIDSYKDIMKEYKQHKSYYLGIIRGFEEVIAIGC
jgi:hypothetical protein